MDRLLFISMATVFASLMPTCVYAQSGQATYTIAGDVADAQDCVFPAGQPVTVRDLLNFTGQNQSQGNAFVLRGLPLRSVGNEHFNPNVASQSTPLSPGDIVVFRTLVDWQSELQNVILMTDSGNEVLQFGKNDQIQLGQLLGTSQAVSGFSVVRSTFESANISQLAANNLVQHGDVVDIRTGLAKNAAVAQADPFASSVTNTNTQTASVGINAANSDSNFGLMIPGMPAGNTNPAAASSPFDFASNANVVKDTADSPFATEEFTTVEQQDLDTAASENSDINSTPGPARNGSLWNALFVLGLVLALGLIVIGWVKTQQERRLELETAEQLRSSISINNTPQNSVTKSAAENIFEPVVLPAVSPEPSAVVSPTVTAASLDVVAEDMTDELWVETEESTTNDLPVAEPVADILTAASPNIDEDCPILCAGFDTKVENEFTVEALSEFLNMVDVAEPTVAEEADRSVALANALVGSDEWFGADWRTVEAKAASPNVRNEEAEILLQPLETLATHENSAEFDDDDVDADLDDTVVEVREARRKAFYATQETDLQETDAAKVSRSELEDLIHNRLPMDLQQISLPLRINLFGKPSGPGRLRIDAAHTQIAPPHMMSAARTGRRSQSMAATAGQGRVMESKPKARTPEPPRDPDVGLPGLDKALNFIDEQADS